MVNHIELQSYSSDQFGLVQPITIDPLYFSCRKIRSRAEDRTRQRNVKDERVLHRNCNQFTEKFPSNSAKSEQYSTN